jgi:hypothetical protein
VIAAVVVAASFALLPFLAGAAQQGSVTTGFWWSSRSGQSFAQGVAAGVSDRPADCARVLNTLRTMLAGAAAGKDVSIPGTTDAGQARREATDAFDRVSGVCKRSRLVAG